MRKLLLAGLVLGIGLAGKAPSPAAERADEAPPYQAQSPGAWIQALGEPNPAKRRRALEALAKRGKVPKEAVAALIEALKDTDVWVRAVAFCVLRQAGCEAERVVPTLIKALGDKDGEARALAAESLEEIGPPAVAAAPALIEALKDKDQQVRWAAIRALGNIGPKAKAVPALIRVFKNQDEIGRYYAGIALLNMDYATVVSALTQVLHNGDDPVRKEAAYLLSCMAALPALVTALTDKDAGVRMLAVRALGGMGSDAKKAWPRLTAALKDEDKSVREVAAKALKYIDPRRAIEAGIR